MDADLIASAIVAFAVAFVAVQLRHALPFLTNRPPWWWR